jgi:Co/Zn/Cd efflux system component
MSEAAPLLHPDSGESRKPYASRRFSDQPREQEQLLLIEGAGDQTADDDQTTLLWGLAIMSFLMTILAIIYAYKANSIAIVVEGTAEFIDWISYSLSLWCVYACRGKTFEEQERMEKKTAIVSTILLGLGGVRIAWQSYEQVACSMDIDFNAKDKDDVPCAFQMGRPHALMVIFTASIMLISYIPPFLVVYLQGTGLASFRPDENINKASALLHCAFDGVLQVSFIIASCIMLQLPDKAVIIDATTSVLMLIVMVWMTTYMWVMYFRAQSRIPETSVPA